MIGVIGDKITTIYGLQNNFYELHQNYTILNAFLFFTFLNFSMIHFPKGKGWMIARYVLLFSSWLGMTFNTITLLSH